MEQALPQEIDLSTRGFAGAYLEVSPASYPRLRVSRGCLSANGEIALGYLDLGYRSHPADPRWQWLLGPSGQVGAFPAPASAYGDLGILVWHPDWGVPAALRGCLPGQAPASVASPAHHGQYRGRPRGQAWPADPGYGRRRQPTKPNLLEAAGPPSDFGRCPIPGGTAEDSLQHQVLSLIGGLAFKPDLYVVSESGIVEPLGSMDTSEATVLLTYIESNWDGQYGSRPLIIPTSLSS